MINIEIGTKIPVSPRTFDPIVVTISLDDIENAKLLYKLSLEAIARTIPPNASGWNCWCELNSFLRKHIMDNVLK